MGASPSPPPPVTCPDGSTIPYGDSCPPPPCTPYTVTQGPYVLPGNTCQSYTQAVVYDCNNYWQSTTPSPPYDNGTCTPCTYDDGNWQNSGGCSVSCGNGTQTQVNNGTNHGRGDCTPSYRTVACSGPPCDPYAGTCNAGSTISPLIDNGGYCSTSHDCKSCNCSNNQCCPQGQCCNEQWGNWTTTSSSITGCRQRTDTQTRTSNCGNTQTQQVNQSDGDTSQCPPCSYGGWTNSGNPTVIGCKTASQVQTRTAVDNGKGDCGPNTQTITVSSIDTSQCAPCTYGAWSNSGNPTVTGCKTASQVQTRTAVDNGKGDCGPTTQTITVPSTDTSKCGACTYGAWTPSGNPTVTGCKTASQAQTRTAVDNGLGDCGPTTQTITVPSSDTSQCAPCTYSQWIPGGPPTITGCKTATQAQTRTAVDNGKGDCGPTTQTVPVPSSDTSKCGACTYSEWTPSGDPTITGCKTATQVQTRTAVDNGKGDCGPTTQTISVPSTDTSKCGACTYSQWTPSGDPTITGCKTATQVQTRTATDNGLGDCGPTTQTISVPTTDISQCPPCQYSEWADSTPCTAPCNGGTKTQSRTILNTYGRGDCNVGLIQTVPCNIQSCAPCTYGTIDTSSLTPCSAPCGGGTQSGNLLVTNTNGNTSCSTMSSTQSCNTLPCAPPIQYHSIPPPVGRLTPVFSNFEIPKYRIRPPAPNLLVASAPVPSNYNNNIPTASDVYAPFAPANSVSYSSCQTNNNLLDSDSLDKFKDLILNAVNNYQKNVSCH